ncbi:MAG: type IV pilus twitching motility protein PilT [Gemmatimonadales bacterium]
MISNSADALRLSDGEIAHIMKGGTQHPLTRQPLGDGQLLLLLREMAPPDVSARLGGADPIEFSYSNAEGRFVARVMRDNGTLRAMVRAVDSPADVSVAAVDVSVTPKPANGSNGSVNGASNGAKNIANGNGNGHSVHVADPAARIEIDRLLRQLVEQEGSDLHLRVGEPPILRVHGDLKRMDQRQPLTGPQIDAMLSSIMPARNVEEFAEVNDTDFAYEIDNLARFRANCFRDHWGAGGVFRVIPAKVATVEALNITQEVQNLCFLSKGLVLVTGPTGSGKSTTLGALVDLMNRTRNEHVITIEDPIEFVHINKKCVITQRQVGVHTDSFKSALRAALREDPDIVLVGEMRDLETISIALETAETGHLVFGTLHTTTAVSTIDRVIDQFPADRQAQVRVMMAESLKGVISQTLVKKIGGGRVAAREILLSNAAVANLIREGKAFQIPSVMQTSRKLGMIQLGDVLIDLVDQGIVEPSEAYIKATDKGAFLAMLRGRGIDTAFAG